MVEVEWRLTESDLEGRGSQKESKGWWTMPESRECRTGAKPMVTSLGGDMGRDEELDKWYGRIQRTGYNQQRGWDQAVRWKHWRKTSRQYRSIQIKGEDSRVGTLKERQRSAPGYGMDWVALERPRW